jgi:hypothetical protein
MKEFTYMIEWFLVLVALAGAIGLSSLIYWAWKSDKQDKNRDR